MKSAIRVELYRGTVDQDSETRGLYIIDDQINPPILEPKLMEHPMQERLAYLVVSMLHIQLDCH